MESLGDASTRFLSEMLSVLSDIVVSLVEKDIELDNIAAAPSDAQWQLLFASLSAVLKVCADSQQTARLAHIRVYSSWPSSNPFAWTF